MMSRLKMLNQLAAPPSPHCKGNFYNIEIIGSFGWLVGWFTPPLSWDGGMARTAIQVLAKNLIKIG